MKNISLLIAVSLPILMVVVIAASIYIPRQSIKPQTNFIYSTEEADGYLYYEYSVVAGKLIYKFPLISEYEKDKPIFEHTFYLHDVESDKSKKITFNEATALKLSNEKLSPDGYEVVRGGYNNSYFFLSVPSSYRDFFIKHKSGGSKKINLQVSNEAAYSYEFVGWIVE